MNDKVYNVLFICTHNSVRSILAEGVMNSVAGARFKAYSAGSHPAGTVNPLALETLQSTRMATEGFRSKNWDEFAQPDAPVMDFVFTVCDRAAGEVCPVWPGQPLTAHWGVSDPALVHGTDAQRGKAVWEAVVILKRRIEYLMALPLHAIDRLSIQREIRDIGQR
jgi:arsenate reductase